MDGNKDEMYAQAQKSLKYGSYFFNSYLLYKYHSNGSRKYSTDHYRNEALKYAHDVDILIYESLIKELDSNNPEVQHMRLHNHNHAIEQEKVRQNKSTLKSSYMIEL